METAIAAPYRVRTSTSPLCQALAQSVRSGGTTAVLEDRWKFSVPPVLYPVGPNDYNKARATVQLLFANGIGARLKGLLALTRIAIFKK